MSSEQQMAAVFWADACLDLIGRPLFQGIDNSSNHVCSGCSHSLLSLCMSVHLYVRLSAHTLFVGGGFKHLTVCERHCRFSLWVEDSMDIFDHASVAGTGGCLYSDGACF